MAKKVRTIRIQDEKWFLHLDAIVGYCETGERNEIYIDPRQTPEQCLRVAVHEWLHARFPSMSEAEIQKLEDELVGGYVLRLFSVTKKQGAW